MKTKIKTIVPRNTTSNQVFLELPKYIRDRSLTDALEFLEKRGVTGDLAVFMLANLQKLGGVA
jgi:hypothetical protein